MKFSISILLILITILGYSTLESLIPEPLTPYILHKYLTFQILIYKHLFPF